MEHLKLFAARLNIPRLIRVCEEQQHWRELVFLYVAYDEYDNAALVMMAHSPTAWEHVQFKDVAVKVSNAEVYYKAVSFYLEQHPDLLVDLLKVRMLFLPNGHAQRWFSQLPGLEKVPWGHAALRAIIIKVQEADQITVFSEPHSKLCIVSCLFFNDTRNGSLYLNRNINWVAKNSLGSVLGNPYATPEPVVRLTSSAPSWLRALYLL